MFRSNPPVQPRVLLLAGFIACVTLLAACAETQDPSVSTRLTQAPAGDFQVEIDGDTVTLRANEASVRDVVEDIARRRGLVLVLQDPLDESVTLNLQQQPLSEALRQILRERDFVLQTNVAPDTRAASDVRAGRLWIFPNGSGGSGHSRASTVTAAGSVGESDAIDADEAIAMLNSSSSRHDPNSRLDAVSTLTEAGGDQAAAALADAALNDADSSVREEALYALGGVGGDARSHVIRRALTAADREVRKAAIGAFEEIGGESSAQSLAVVLSDTDVSLRVAAVDALGEIGGDAATRLLQQALTDEQISVREAAAEVLAEL